jgi:hypothetical protein
MTLLLPEGWRPELSLLLLDTLSFAFDNDVAMLLVFLLSLPLLSSLALGDSHGGDRSEEKSAVIKVPALFPATRLGEVKDGIGSVLPSLTLGGGGGTVCRAGTNSTVWESAAAAGRIIDAACWNGRVGAGKLDPQLDFAATVEAGNQLGGTTAGFIFGGPRCTDEANVDHGCKTPVDI